MIKQSTLSVITKAKLLTEYVFTVTQKAPKQYRFSIIGRMQSYSLDVVENLCKRQIERENRRVRLISPKEATLLAKKR